MAGAANHIYDADEVLAASFDADAGAIRVLADGGSGGGDASAANQVAGNASLASIDGKTPALVGGAQPVTGPLTDAQLRAAVVPVAPNTTRGAGVIDANTLRVVQASDSPSILPPAPTVVSGIFTASAAAAVIADTGDLAAGSYLVEITMGFSGASAAGKHLIAERRNAADSGTVHTLAMCPAGGAMGVAFARVDLAANESIRVVVGAVAAAASEVTTACIRAHKIA